MIDLTAAQLGAFMIGTVLIILLPGPNSLFVATTSTRHGAAAGLRAAAGVLLGDSVLMLLAFLGAASLLQAGSAFFTVLQWAGALYLAYLGIGLIRAGTRRWRAPGPAEATSTGRDVSPVETARRPRPFRRALIACLLNPKAILFFAAFFVQFLSGDLEHPWATFLTLAGLLQLVSATYLGSLIVIGSRLGARLAGSRLVAGGGSVLAGVAFFGFALRLAWGAV